MNRLAAQPRGKQKIAFAKFQTISIKARIIMLVMVPLIIQLALIAKFMQLYGESERALASSERYGEVIETLNEMDAHMFRLIQVFYGVKLNINTAGSAHSMINNVSKDLDAPIAKLRELAKDDPQSTHILNRLVGVRDDLSASVEKLASQILQGVGDYDKAMMAKQFSIVAHGASITLPELEGALQKLAYKKRQEGKRLKEEERSMIAIFALIDFGFATLATIALLTSTSTKLRKLKANVDNYAREKPLTPPSGGNDEIDVIDRAFFDTANKLKILHRKERALIYESQDPIVFLDAHGTILFTNLAASKLVRENLSFLDYVESGSQKAVVTFLQDVSKGLERQSLETELDLDSRRRVILSAVLEPEENSLLCIIHDITERYEVESIRQEVVSMFTHDLRNPLTSLTLALENLAEKPELKTYEKTLTRAQNNVSRMSTLITDLLDLYKTEAGLMQFEKSRFLASDLCAGAVEEVTDSANHLNVKIQTNLSDELLVQADYKSSLRIVVNMLSNAIKYSPAGSIIKLNVGPYEKNIAFQVVDSGPGIPEEEQPYVFNRFQQVSTSKSSRMAGLGSGLGLAICKAFAERQGGKMTLTSKPGVGSAFTCLLPRP
jgi:signal transduction histidine kinase